MTTAQVIIISAVIVHAAAAVVVHVLVLIFQEKLTLLSHTSNVVNET